MVKICNWLNFLVLIISYYLLHRFTENAAQVLSDVSSSHYFQQLHAQEFFLPYCWSPALGTRNDDVSLCEGHNPYFFSGSPSSEAQHISHIHAWSAAWTTTEKVLHSTAPIYDICLKRKYRHSKHLPPLFLVETELHEWKHTHTVLQIHKIHKNMHIRGSPWVLTHHGPSVHTIVLPASHINRFPGILFCKFSLMLNSKEMHTHLSHRHPTLRFSQNISTHPLTW